MEVPSLSANGFPLQLLVVALVLLAMMDLIRGYDFYAGGRDGWVLHPSESYSHWAERNRFQVSDSIVFAYEKGKDSVLMVPEHDFYSCNLSRPLLWLDGGNDRFAFNHSGLFFFVSGAPGKCELGQKLEVVVMAIRHWPPPPHSTPCPAPKAPPPLSVTPPPVPDAFGSWTSPAPAPAQLPATSDAAAISSLGIVIAITQFVLLIQIL
ncbi:early nodulin-like protein 1 [Zingiber officinale]|nr:early nodulin-like protein 1 [Zingiber officinale]